MRWRLILEEYNPELLEIFISFIDRVRLKCSTLLIIFPFLISIVYRVRLICSTLHIIFPVLTSIVDRVRFKCSFFYITNTISNNFVVAGK